MDKTNFHYSFIFILDPINLREIDGNLTFSKSFFLFSRLFSTIVLNWASLLMSARSLQISIEIISNPERNLLKEFLYRLLEIIISLTAKSICFSVLHAYLNLYTKYIRDYTRNNIFPRVDNHNLLRSYNYEKKRLEDRIIADGECPVFIGF